MYFPRQCRRLYSVRYWPVSRTQLSLYQLTLHWFPQGTATCCMMHHIRILHYKYNHRSILWLPVWCSLAIHMFRKKKCSTFSLTGNPFSNFYFLFITFFLCLFSCRSLLYITCFQNSCQTVLRPWEKFIIQHHMFLALNGKPCAHKQYFQTEDCCLLLGTADGI
jgi:hypothetical protein